MDQRAALGVDRLDPGGPGKNPFTFSRRTLIRRTVAAGGLVWVAPAITTLARARAAGTPPPSTTTPDTTPRPIECSCTFCATVDSPTGTLYYSCGPSTPEDCDCLCKCAGKDTHCTHDDPCAIGVICTPTLDNQPCQ